MLFFKKSFIISSRQRSEYISLADSVLRVPAAAGVFFSLNSNGTGADPKSSLVDFFFSTT
jgi:hypothetical protein